jgi:hypothetical protein
MRMLDDWTAALAERLAAELDLDVATLLDVDVAMLLDVARDAAHHVVRPAAPITTFLVGYAAGCRGDGPDALARAARAATDLALGWDAS